MSTSSSESRFGSSWLQFLKRPLPFRRGPRQTDASSHLFLSVPQSVSAWAAAIPNATAITGGSETLTYAELDANSNALARVLQSLGVSRESVVALNIERSPALAVAALAAWKAGAAYLPLDPSWPSERLRTVLEDSRAAMLIHNGMAAPLEARHPTKVIDLTARDLLRSHSTDCLKTSVQPSQLAYIIYTSGSTGRPKGVEIDHANLLNLVYWHQAAFAVSTSDRATMVASPGFDAAVWEIWPYLASGASLVVPGDATRFSPRGLRDWMIANAITISFAPTPMAQRLLLLDWPAETPLRYLLTGADVLHYYPRPGLPFTLVNNYGPTECTVVALSGTVTPNPAPSAPPCIGRPISNTQVFVLDETLQPVPLGSVGELHIAGACVGRGYRNDPELTREKFVPNPFDARSDSRLYRTGDLVRALPDGTFEFVGRTDDQIKIRGYRVEPNEICAALCSHEFVQSAVVVPRQDSAANRFLAAYVILSPGAEVSSSALRTHLQTRLPDYMIPAAFVPVDAFPLTSSGKIDRAALPPPTAANSLRAEPVPSRIRTQEALQAIVSSLLNLKSVAPEDNFFLLGGHSLLGAQLLAAIQEKLQVELPLRTVFDFPTVAGLSSEIDRVRASQHPQSTSATENANPREPGIQTF